MTVPVLLTCESEASEAGMSDELECLSFFSLARFWVVVEGLMARQFEHSPCKQLRLQGRHLQGFDCILQFSLEFDGALPMRRVA